MFSPIHTTPKITSYHPKTPLNPYKLRLQSNSTKIFKKSIQITQNKTPLQPHFTNKNQAFSAIQSSKNHSLTEPIKIHITNSNIINHQTNYSRYQSHLTLISHTNREVYDIAALLKIYLTKKINNMNNITITTLQVTDFNFYGDNLIALKYNSKCTRKYIYRSQITCTDSTAANNR